MGTSTRRSWKLQEFLAHSSSVTCLALGHQTGRVLVTGGKDAKVNLWAVGKHNCIMSLSGHASEIRSVQFGNTDEVVCAGSAGGVLKVWDLNATKLIKTLTGHKSAISCSEFHPYGDFLASGSNDKTIRLWDFRRKGSIFKFDGHNSTINSLKFSPDGQWIASAGEDGLVNVWDIRAGRLLKQFSDHNLAVTCIQFHPNDFLLSSGSKDGRVNFYDLENFNLVSSTDHSGGAVYSMAFSKHGECLYTGTDEGMKVYAWEPARLLDTENVKWGQVKDIALSEDQMIGASHSFTNVSLYVLNLKTLPPVVLPRECSNGSQLDLSLNNSNPFSSGQSVRKSFSRERSSGLRPIDVIKTIDEGERSEIGTDPEEEMSMDIHNKEDYMNIFQPQRSLNRTPPPHPSPTEEEDARPFPEKPLDASSQLSSLEFADCDTKNTISQPVLINPERSHNFNQNEVIVIGSSESDHSTVLSSAPNSPPIIKPSLYRQHSYKDFPSVRNTKNILDDNYSTGLKHSASVEVGLNRPASKVNIVPQNNTRNYFRDNNSQKYQNSGNNNLNTGTYLAPLATSVAGKTPQNREMRAPAYTKGTIQTNLKKKSAVTTPPLTPKPQNKNISDPLASLSNECDQFIPMSNDRPVGLDLDEFLPKSHQHQFDNLSEQEVLNTMMGGHDKIMTVLTGRQRSLQVVFAQLQGKDMKAALEYVRNMQDNTAVLVDLLRTFIARPSMWDLDMCVSLLPQIHELLQSKYESYVTTGCEALRLILQNFSSVILNNVTAPCGSFGVDIPREERYAKCLKCHDSLLNTRAFLLKRQTLQGKLGTTFRELQTMMQGLDV